MKVVSKYTLVAGGSRIKPGTIVEIEDVEARSLIKRGLVRQPSEEDVIRTRRIMQQQRDAERTEASRGGDEGGKSLSSLTREELEARATELGIDLESIKGTGQGGNVVKADLVRAIEAAEAEGDGGDEGDESEPPTNPSLA